MVPLRIKIPKDKFDKVLDLYSLLESDTPNLQIGVFLYMHFTNKSFVDDCYSSNFYLLNYAVQTNNLYAVRVLIKTCYCADMIETEDENKKTPLAIAVENKNEKIIEYLLRKGAVTNLQMVSALMRLNIW